MARFAFFIAKHVVLVALTLSMFGVSHSARASEDFYTFKSVLSSGNANWCIDVPGGQYQSGTHLTVSSCNGKPAQTFGFESGGTLTAGGFCVEVHHGHGSTTLGEFPATLPANPGGAARNDCNFVLKIHDEGFSLQSICRLAFPHLQLQVGSAAGSVDNRLMGHLELRILLGLVARVGVARKRREAAAGDFQAQTMTLQEYVVGVTDRDLELVNLSGSQ